MHFQSAVILASAATGALAMPTEKRENKAVDWVSNEDGNLIVSFSDTLVPLGTVSVDNAFDALNKACSEEGTCDTNDVPISGQFIDGGMEGKVEDITVTITPNGAYPTWIHNGLLDTLYAAVKAVAQCEDVTRTTYCPGNPMSYCPDQEITVNECKVPAYWSINYQAKDAANAAPPNIGTKVAYAVDSNGFCSTFTTIGNAVAGAVNGAAGGVFTLLGLACKDD
ncbi:hypothetical protein F4777DRAFT_579458 [Nemania sp. FL0916]|nr:hypothetical protein F4777DRAFT_579458 [Nemania sp. FL0916]